MKRRLARNERLVWRDVAGEVVILAQDSGAFHVLNGPASLIWTCADGDRDLDEIARALCDKYEVPLDQARSDTEEFCQELVEADLASLEEAVEVARP